MQLEAGRQLRFVDLSRNQVAHAVAVELAALLVQSRVRASVDLSSNLAAGDTGQGGYVAPRHTPWGDGEYPSG